MRSTLRWMSAFPLALALVLTGCGSNPDPVAPTAQTPSGDEVMTQAEVGRYPELVDDDGATESEDQTEVQGGSAGAVADAIRPLFFWRHITEIDRRFEFAFADSDSTGRPTTAIVTVHKHLRGTFNILTPTSNDDPIGEGRIVRKRLADHWVRRILLRRLPENATDRMRPWRIVATSGVKITSRDAVTNIQSLRIQSGDLDTTLTDPLAFHRLRRILRFEPDTEVTLTVTTDAADDVVVLYARGRRFRFDAQGDGTYVGVWKAPALRGVRHLGVNALSHGTVFDDQAPYDSKAWVFPYVVKPTQLADEMP